MSKTINLRQVSLKSMGGRVQVCSLPREKRALALASLMNEGPVKTNSRQACFMAAFACAVERGDASAAKKRFQHVYATNELGQARELVSAKVEKLKAEGKDGLAAQFEIAFGLSEEAKSRFVAQMGEDLKEAEQKLDSDYALAHVLFANIMEKEEGLGVQAHTEGAALGLASTYLRKRMTKDALGIIEQHLLKEGKVEGIARVRLIEEIQNMMGRTSDDALNKIARHAEKKGLMPLMQEAVLGLTSEGMLDLERCKEVFGLMQIFGLKDNAKRLGAFLVNTDMGMADAQPQKFYKNYLDAARIAAKIDLMDQVDEAMVKYLAVSREIGKEKPELLGTVALVAMEFSRYGEAKEFGRKAFAHYISEGNLEEAENIALKMNLFNLCLVAQEMRRRTEL